MHRIVGESSPYWTLSPTATTDANGAYTFANMRPGSYVLAETQPAAFLDGKDTPGTVNGVSADITASGGTEGTQTITISKGSTFAYLLFKVKDWNSGKTQIEDLEDDTVGLT